MSKFDDVSQDWPDEPENAELVSLAEELANAAPVLPATALARVGAQMRAEIDGLDRQQRWRRVAFGLSVAAAVVLAVAGFTYFRGGSEFAQPQPRIVRKVEPTTPVAIEDRVAIAVSEGAPAAATEKSLVRLEEYRSLFSD